MASRRIALRVGDVVEYLGSGYSRPNGETMTPGDVGTVDKVLPPEKANPLLADDETGEMYPGINGYARVVWPRCRPALVWPEDEGKQWRKAPQ